MDSKLKELCDRIEKETNYEVRWVHMWHEIGTVDSVIYDSYEDASQDIGDYITVVPILLEKDED